MNKYQEAYNTIFDNLLPMPNLSENDKQLLFNSMDIFQELIDKVTPKKPIIKELERPDGKGGKEFWEYLYQCPTCEENYKKNKVIHHFNSLDKGIPYCKYCGQKLDWSDKNE